MRMLVQKTMHVRRRDRCIGGPRGPGVGIGVIEHEVKEENFLNSPSSARFPD